MIVKLAAAVTVSELEPEIDAEEMSVAISVCVPAVSSVADKLLELPPASVVFAGSFAWASLLVKCTVPA